MAALFQAVRSGQNVGLGTRQRTKTFMHEEQFHNNLTAGPPPTLH
jgi:hypothetical protein